MHRSFTDLDFRWAMQGGLKMLSIRLDSIESTRIVSPVVDSSCRKSICETRAPCESSRDVTCKSSRIVKCFRRIDSVSVYWSWMEGIVSEIIEYYRKWSSVKLGLGGVTSVRRNHQKYKTRMEQPRVNSR